MDPLYERDIHIPGTDVYLDFTTSHIGIIILNKIADVYSIKHAVLAIDYLKLKKIVIISKNLSITAETLLDRIKYPIDIIHPFELTELLSLILKNNTFIQA